MSHSGGRFDFDDGGTYCGGWENGKAHGQGICTGPMGQGEYAGSWSHGFEVLGVYTWPSGNTYEGSWADGKRHQLGVETKGKWQYKGEWGHGYKGRYGVRSSTTSRARYEGTWTNGLQDGYGTETYADGGTYQGQWAGGMRQGSGIRQSMPYGMASVLKGSFRNSLSSLRSEHSNGNLSNIDLPADAPVGSRGGFVLTRYSPSSSTQSGSSAMKRRLFRNDSLSLRQSVLKGLKIRSKSSSSIASRSSRMSVKSNKSYKSEMCSSASNDSSSLFGSESEPGIRGMGGLDPAEEEIDVNTTETYYGEWKNDSRTGYGVCRRSDGFTYEGEWLNNQRHGYGRTSFPDGTAEEGKYKLNAIGAGSRSQLLPIKSGKIKSKVGHAVEQARKAKEAAVQKSDIASSRTAHSVSKASQAEAVAHNALEEAKIARCVARDLDPKFHQPGLEYMKLRGEDPFKDVENGGSLYLAEAERNDVAGPESYHQFSNNKHGLTASPVPSRSGSIDANAMDINIRRQSSAKQTPSNSPAHQFGRNTDASLEVPQQTTTAAATTTLRVEPPSPLPPSPVPPSPTAKMQYLSPDSAYDPTPSVQDQKKDSSKRTPRNLSASSHSLDKAPARSPKHSFFKSLRIRNKKTSVSQRPAAPISPSPSPSQFSSFQEGSSSADDPTGGSWRRGSAQDKRNMWKKSMTSPERIMGNSLSRSYAESFDFEPNQAEFLSGYEKEMTQASFDEQQQQQHQRMLSNSNSLPNHQRYQQDGYTQGYPQHQQGYSHSPALPRSGFHSRENSSSNLNALQQGYGSRLNPGYSFDQQAVNQQQQQQQQQQQRRMPRSETDQSLSMAALRPRDLDRDEQGWVEPPKQCTPAFANYSSPGDADKASQRFLAEAVSDKLTKQARIRPSANMRDSVYDEDSMYARDSVIIEDVSRSPLPGSLRRRLGNGRTKEEENDVTGCSQANAEEDSTRTYLIILVMMLNIGFLALFLQFLT